VINRNFFVKWFAAHGREFPWRANETTPFQFLVTEILLQQTKAADVAGIWLDLFSEFPNALALSQADIDDLENKIKFLGFGKKRAKALKEIGAWLVENHAGNVPGNREQLLVIPYVGLYATHAVLCFAFNRRIEIVDANVIRLFNRYYGMQLNKDARRAPASWEIARELLPRERIKAKAHNYGLLDFTAQICRPVKPLCEICPLVNQCHYGQSKIALKNAIPDLSG
jgi:A/G-specific adenine glycosylase